MPPLIKDFSWTIISDLLLAKPRLVTENKCLWLPEGMGSDVTNFVLFIIGLTLVLVIPQLLGDRQRQAKLYRLTLSTVSDAVFITDRQGYFTFICPNVDNIFGYTSQEVANFGNIAKLLGEKIFDAQDLETLGEIQNIEREITDKKGKKHNLLVNIKRVAINKGCYLYTCHDITERKQTEEELQQYRHRLEKLVDIRTAELAKVNEQLAQEIREHQQTEEALRESQHQLATIAANIPGVVFRYIIHADGKVSIPYISPGLQELIGVSPEEIIAHPERIFDRVHGEDSLQLEKAIAASAKTLTPLNHEYRLISTSGKEQWVRAIARLHRLNNNDIVLDGLSLDITPYKFAQEALRESESTNRALISGIPDALFYIDRDGTFLDFVPSSEFEVLVSPSEFLGKKIVDIFPSSMAKEQMRVVEKAVESGNTEIYEYQLPIEGRTRDYEARIVVTGKAKDRVLAIVRDISDRKQAERALQAQIQRTELILQTAIDGFCMMSLNGCFINVNPAFCAIIGYSQAEILGMDIRQLEVLESFQEAAKHLENIFQVGSDHCETKLRRKDGQIVDIEASSTFAEIGEARFIFSFVRDITERKQIEASLRLQAQIIDQIHDSVIVTDLDGYIKSWNRGAERLYGYLATEAINKHILLLHEPDSELFVQQQVIQPLLEKGQHELEVSLCNKKGENHWVHLSLSAIVDSTDNPIGMIGYSIDINDRKLAESALRESEERFRQLAENLTDVFWMMTADKKEMLYVSPAFESMSGYAQEILYQNPRSLIAAFHPEDRDRIVAAFLKIPSKKYDEEYRIIKPDGTIRWIRSRAFPIEKEPGKIYRIAGISQDITEQKKAEEERDRIFNLSLDLLGIAGFDGYFKQVNPAVTKMLGYSNEEFLSKPFLSFIHREDRSATFCELKKLIAGESILYFENRYLCKDGTYKWLTWTAFPVLAARLIYAVARDTTERKKAEEALKESREKYRVLFEIFPLGITITDETGNIIDVNPASEEIVGLSKKEHTKTTLDSKKWQILRSDGTLMPTDEFASVRALKENRLIENVEMGIITTHNKVTWLNVTAAPIPLKGYGVAVAYIDITERKQAETSLKYRAALQQLIGDISTNFLNLPSTEIDRGINQALQALGEFIGVDRAYVFMFAEGSTKMRNTHQWCQTNVEPQISIQGLSLEDLAFSYELIKRGEPLIIGCLADLPETAQAEKTEFELQGIKSLLLVPLIAGGSVAGAIGCDTIFAEKTWAEDCITLLKIVGEIIVTTMKRRHFEQQLEQRAADLTRSNAELEQFAYVASHDLQEPLRMVASYTQLLARRYSGQLDTKADKYIAYAVDGAIRMQQLIQDLLKYSRVGTRGKEFAPVNCQTVFATAVKNLEIAIQESNALVTCDSLPVVIGDDIQLVQLFQNLIGNAIKYRGDRPIVNIKAQYREAAWLFSVSDNGIGIASQHAERIFQIFQRLHTREEYSGTGIGLAICKKIVERHGGRIWLESKLGEGATFYFTISDSESTLL